LKTKPAETQKMKTISSCFQKQVSVALRKQAETIKGAF